MLGSGSPYEPHGNEPVKRAPLPYRRDLAMRARELRKNSTLAEVLLWNYLKGGQRCGVDFHRQKPIGEHIVDFFAPELMLAVEIDGATHNFKAERDAERQLRLEAMGVRVLRFGDGQVRDNPAGVAALIDRWIEHDRKRSHDGPAGNPHDQHTPA